MTTGQDTDPSPELAEILVGVDGSPESLYALDLAAVVGGPVGANLTIVHVHQRHPALVMSAVATNEHDQAIAEVDAIVRAAADERLSGYSGKWTVASRRGNVAQELIAAADEADADLIVVGHRSYGPIRDAILGSVAAGTVHRSRRSVLVAIPPSGTD